MFIVVSQMKTKTAKMDSSCPKCGNKGSKTESNPNTGKIFVFCSNKSCHSLLGIDSF